MLLDSKWKEGWEVLGAWRAVTPAARLKAMLFQCTEEPAAVHCVQGEKGSDPLYLTS